MECLLDSTMFAFLMRQNPALSLPLFKSLRELSINDGGDDELFCFSVCLALG